jgi:pyruvate,orthophosphate dikinase
MNKVCIVNCRDLVVSPGGTAGHVRGRKVSRGDVLSVDGNSGEVYAGRVEVSVERPTGDLELLRSWREKRFQKAEAP